MIDPSRVLLTGGTGRLGKELQVHLPGIIAPSHAELDITCESMVSDIMCQYQPTVILHAAAFTDVAAAEHRRTDCWRVNVEGTRNLVKAASHYSLIMVHISTDYVFDGKCGMYREDDPLGPVCNYYALSKLVAEEVVRVLPRHLIIRTSFRGREWVYPTAFDDVVTSQDYVDMIAPEIALAVRHCDEIPFRTVHIAGRRQSVYELARSRKPDVRRGSKREVNVVLPDDISLDSARWSMWKECLKEQDRT